MDTLGILYTAPIIIFLCYTSAHQIPRDNTGRIKRSVAVVRQFKQSTGYPKGRTGYAIDHVIPLKRGGCDSVDNLQWLPVDEHKFKSISE